MSSMDCTNDNTLKINETGTFTHSVSGNYYNGDNEQQPAIICVAIAAQIQCMNPTVTVSFAQIDYYYSVQYLNISYQSKSNVINNEPCGDATNKCGQFKDCAVNNSLIDKVWTNETSPYVFYLINSQVCFIFKNNK